MLAIVAYCQWFSVDGGHKSRAVIINSTMCEALRVPRMA